MRQHGLHAEACIEAYRAKSTGEYIPAGSETNSILRRFSRTSPPPGQQLSFVVSRAISLLHHGTVHWLVSAGGRSNPTSSVDSVDCRLLLLRARSGGLRRTFAFQFRGLSNSNAAVPVSRCRTLDSRSRAHCCRCGISDGTDPMAGFKVLPTFQLLSTSRQAPAPPDQRSPNSGRSDASGTRSMCQERNACRASNFEA